MSDHGFAYIPENCFRKSCRVHVELHGCWQIEENIGLKYVKHTGMNELAESNDLIILYPQLTHNDDVNPGECWNTHGYYQRPYDYMGKSGEQNDSIYQAVMGLKDGTLKFRPLT
jgi:poly(3-hydroxybutyrate) depolymerase